MKLKLTNISSRRAFPKKKKFEELFHLLKRTDKWIVCEGVETKEMVDFLIAEGCDELQGFYYYKPMEQKKFEELIA